jgi:NosR/NirI family nitrous oxide reductase transcriptional regulator
MFARVRTFVEGILHSPDMPSPRPVIDDRFESNVPGIYVIGELAGAPVVKLAMEQGYTVAHHIGSLPNARGNDPNVYDVLIAGSGAAGLNAALEAQQLGLRTIVLEKGKVANAIQELPEGKWIYTEPHDRPVAGSLWLEEATKEDLTIRWQEDVLRSRLELRTNDGVVSIEKASENSFTVRTDGGTSYRARRIIIATGKSGTPRKLGIPGEESDRVHHKFYTSKPYRGKTILVVGGGNSAVEAAVALAEHARVTLAYRGSDFYRISKANARALQDARLEVILNSKIIRFDSDSYTIAGEGTAEQPRPYDHAFVLIGSEPPSAFLHSLGLRLESDWTFKRYALLVCMFLLCYSIYGIKQGPGHEFWPYRNWGWNALSFFNRPWSFWYTVLYTSLMTIFGIQAAKRWGFDRKDRFQIWRYVSLISFQWIFFFLIPEFLFRSAVQAQWLGTKLAADPGFANNAWRSYGLIYAWPLFFYTFFDNPNQVWIVWGALLSFVLVPVLVLFHGKRYCSWICGCGGLAETLGDRWRHLAPKGETSIRWERMNSVVLVAAAAITLMVVGRDALAVFRTPSAVGRDYYHLIADTWLVGIIPVTLYPFFGGKVWCRYWCPLAKMMEIFSKIFTRFRVSRFSIQSNDKCIACEDCSRNCQVGIDVMRYALKQEEITNDNSSCIGCGICVTVCPMDVLSFAKPKHSRQELVQITSAA